MSIIIRVNHGVRSFFADEENLTDTCIAVTKRDLEQFFYKIEILTLWESFFLLYYV